MLGSGGEVHRFLLRLACSFENYLSYSALAGSDDKAVVGGFDDSGGDDMKVRYAEDSLDLSEEPGQRA